MALRPGSYSSSTSSAAGSSSLSTTRREAEAGTISGSSSAPAHPFWVPPAEGLDDAGKGFRLQVSGKVPLPDRRLKVGAEARLWRTRQADWEPEMTQRAVILGAGIPSSRFAGLVLIGEE